MIGVLWVGGGRGSKGEPPCVASRRREGVVGVSGCCGGGI